MYIKPKDRFDKITILPTENWSYKQKSVIHIMTHFWPFDYKFIFLSQFLKRSVLSIRIRISQEKFCCSLIFYHLRVTQISYCKISRKKIHLAFQVNWAPLRIVFSKIAMIYHCFQIHYTNADLGISGPAETMAYT